MLRHNKLECLTLANFSNQVKSFRTKWEPYRDQLYGKGSMLRMQLLLTRKDWTQVEIFSRVKCSSLLCRNINYVPKEFYNFLCCFILFPTQLAFLWCSSIFMKIVEFFIVPLSRPGLRLNFITLERIFVTHKLFCFFIATLSSLL